MALHDQTSRLTAEAADFIARLTFADLPAEALRIGKRCLLDGLGVILAGSTEPCAGIVRDLAVRDGGRPEATVFGRPPQRLPAAAAALVNGTAGHALDWDDTQLSTTPDRTFGLLTHPTIPPLAAGLALAEARGGVSGRDFLTAFLAGFEVECKIAEAIRPAHYQRGFHTSGTIGIFGAAAAAGRLLGLDAARLRRMLGIAASMGAGLRCNFGTMTKPLHVGRAAQNGVTAARLAAAGYEADPAGLDGPWGFFQVFGGGLDMERIAGRLGRPHAIVDPGVSVKPYPCGSLTHPSLDAMQALVLENDLCPGDIEGVVLYAGRNILDPIRYTAAEDPLQAKFCMPFLLAAMILARKVGRAEFTPEFVASREVRDLMGRVRTEFDPEIERRGYDRMRSRLEVTLSDGRRLVREAEIYRGGPDHPLTDEELRRKFEDATSGLLTDGVRERLAEAVFALEGVADVSLLVRWAADRPG
jgi:2-methylcitrate dehydratase PrpD